MNDEFVLKTCRGKGSPYPDYTHYVRLKLAIGE